MTLTEKFEKLTPEQREKFNTVKDSAGLDTFLSETGFELTADEKAQVTELIISGKLPLSDDDLNAAAGGQTSPVLVQAWKKLAQGENRPTHVGQIQDWHGWQDGICPECNQVSAMFCTYRVAAPTRASAGKEDFYFHNAKCYICDTVFPAPLRMSWANTNGVVKVTKPTDYVPY